MGKATLKPYPAYNPSGIDRLGDVPAHWKVCRLKNWVSINENVLPETTDPSYEFHYLEIGAVGTGTLTDEPTRIRFASSPSRARRILNYGDTIVSTVRTYLKAVWFAETSSENLICSTGFTVLSPGKGTVPKFVSYLAQSDSFTDRVTAESVGTAYPAIAEGKLSSFHVAVPPLDEQAAIVRYLDRADDRIRHALSAKERLIELLEERRKAATLDAMQSAGATHLRLEVVADLAQRPVMRLPERSYTAIGLYNRGRGLFLKEPRNGNDLGDSEFFWVEKGDLVISGQFAWEGAIALAADAEDGCVASHRYPILRGKPGILNSAYLLAFFQTAWGQLILDHYSRGAAGRNRPLNAKSLMKEKVILPTIDSQLKIAEMLRQETHLRQQVILTKRLLNEYRTRLIADVVTGQVDVRDTL